uniref:Uncharacterized protein n=1 Tax=Glossina palpalis gambiensis TaxID=67801 RepID=A0A1B0AWI3_9MUSC
MAVRRAMQSRKPGALIVIDSRQPYLSICGQNELFYVQWQLYNLITSYEELEKFQSVARKMESQCIINNYNVGHNLSPTNYKNNIKRSSSQFSVADFICPAALKIFGGHNKKLKRKQNSTEREFPNISQ